MPALAEAFIRVRANAAGMGRDLAGQVTGEGRAAEAAAESLGLRMGRRMRVSITEQMKGVAGPLIASLAVFATFEGLKEMGKDAEEAAKETRLTEAAIRSTGEAAHVSAKEVEELAKHLSETTGKNEEVIHTGENLLLTFTGIKNAAGDNNDIFDQATAAITDMSAAMNNGAVTQESMKASAIQLGKALNNPIAGMTALQRIGVSFTEAQKDQIKALAESGNLLGAQKIILKEVNTEFGGAAAASSSAMDRLGAKVHALKVQIGEEFIPVFNTAANWLAEKFAPAASRAFASLEVGEKVKNAATSVKEFAGELIGHLEPGMVDTWHAAQSLWKISMDLYHIFEPLAVTAAKLAAALGVGAFLALAKAIAEVTGFLAQHQSLVLLLATAYGIHLAGGLIRIVALMRAIPFNLVVAGTLAYKTATDAATASLNTMAIAQGVATLGIGLLVVGLLNRYQQWQQAGKKTAESISESMKTVDKNSSDALNHLAATYQKHSNEVAKNNHLIQEQGQKYQGHVQDIHNLNDAHDKLIAKSQQVGIATTALSLEFGVSEGRVRTLANAAKIDLSGSFGQVEEKFGSYVQSLNEGGAKQTELVEDMKDLAASAGDAKKQLEALKNALDDLTGKQLGINEATRNYQGALDDLTASVTKNGKTLDLTGEKGRANSEALDKVSTSIKDMIEAEVAAGDSTDKVTSDFGSMYDQLIKTAEQTGMSEEAAKAYAASLGLIPENVNVLIAEAGAQQSKEQTDAFAGALDRLQGRLIPVGQTGAQFAKSQVAALQTQVNVLQGKIVTIGQSGAADAKAQIDALQGSINSLHSRQVSIDIVTTLRNDAGLSGAALRNARLTLGQAEGGVWMQSFADGGFNGAKILPPGPTVWQWREPSTGGEAFIPMGVWHRSRSSAILGEVARRFGYQLVRQLPRSTSTTGTPVSAPSAAGAGPSTAARMHPADLAAIAGRPTQVDVYLNSKLIDSQIGRQSNLRVRGG